MTDALKAFYDAVNGRERMQKPQPKRELPEIRELPELEPYVSGCKDPSKKWPFQYNRKPVHGMNGVTIMARFKTAEEANYFAEVVNSLYDDED